MHPRIRETKPVSDMSMESKVYTNSLTVVQQEVTTKYLWRVDPEKPNKEEAVSYTYMHPFKW